MTKKEKIDLPDMKYGNFDYPGVTTAIRTRTCHICHHKIYPKESHFFRLHPFSKRVRAQEGTRLIADVGCPDFIFRAMARENICVICGRDYFSDASTQLRVKARQFKKLYRRIDKYIDQSDIKFRRVLEDKL